MILKKISIKNFKGIQDFSCEFCPGENRISGENGTGKTTVFDAFQWCMDGSDSTGNSSFAICPKDSNGNVIQGLIPAVECVFVGYGEEIVFAKMLVEKTERVPGSTEKRIVGYTNKCKIHHADVSVSEYQKSVSDNFKLLTNPFYFATNQIAGKNPAWIERRTLLLSLINREIPDIQLTNKKKGLKQRLSLISKELEKFDGLINEKQMCIKPCDTAAASKEITRIRGIISEKEEILRAGEPSDRVRIGLVRSIQDAEMDLSLLVQRQKELTERAKADAAEDKKRIDVKIEAIQQLITNTKNDIETDSKRVSEIDTELTVLRNQFASMATLEYVFDGEKCNFCGQYLPPEKILEMQIEGEKLFSAQKNKKMFDIKAIGLRKTNDKKTLMEGIENDKYIIVEAQEQLQKLLPKMGNPVQIEIPLVAEINKKHQEIDGLKSKLSNMPVVTSVINLDAIKAEISSLNDQIIKLSEHETIHRNNKEFQTRINQLKSNQIEQNKQFLSIEKDIFEIENLISETIKGVQADIDAKFSDNVRIKMFDVQKNGEIVDACEVMVNTNGSYVEFSSANHAGKVNAGIEIINVFSAHFNEFLPIFIDFRESVTDIITTKSQIINLVKDSNYKQLTIGSSNEQNVQK